MFCNNCGTKLKDGISFCPNCGAAVMIDDTVAEDDDKTVILGDWAKEAKSAAVGQPEEAIKEDVLSGQTDKPAGGVSSAETIETVAISPTGVVETGMAVAIPNNGGQKKFCPNCGAQNSLNDLFCQQCGMFFGNAEAKMNSGDTAVSKRKGGAGKMVALIDALLVVIGLGIVTVPHIIDRGTKEKDFVMYFKDNELTMARRSKYEPMIVGDKIVKNYDDYTDLPGDLSSLIQYTSDYQYVYYPQKMDDGSYDLYRKKLDSKKAEAEKIESHVTNYGLIDNDRVFYVKDSKLYLHNRGETEKIVSDVLTVRVSADGKYIMWLDADRRLYVQDTDLKSDKVKLDSDVFQIYAVSDDYKIIVYQKEGKLYVMRDMEEKEKIASDVYMAYIYDINGSLKMYYLKRGSQEGLSYYDLVDDDCLSQDSQTAEPRIEDYQRVTYKDSFWGMRESVEIDEIYYDELNKYLQKLQRDYLRDQLENDLLEMEEFIVYYYEDATGESKKVLTALRRQLGYTTNSSVAENTALMCVYNIDRENFEEPKLSDIHLNYTPAYDSRGVTSINDVMGLSEMGNVEAIEQEIIELLGESGQFLYIENGELHEIEDFECNKSNTMQPYFNAVANEEKKILYIWNPDEHKRLYSLNYGDRNDSPELITDEFKQLVSWDMDEICYINEDDELYYGDTKIAEDVGSYKNWEGEMILYLTDMDKDGEEGTLHVYHNGEDIEIADDVAIGLYGMFDTDKVVFLSDYNFNKFRGDLNLYDGKKIRKIDSDVTMIIY